MGGSRATGLRKAAFAAVAALVLPAPAFAQAAGERGDFYLRAGAGRDESQRTRFLDKDCASDSPAALYGCGRGPDGAPRSSRGDFGALAGFEFGVGYVAAPALRLEAVVSYLPDFSFDGRANFLQTSGRQEVSADLSALTGMLAAYLDLSALGLPRLGPFEPFVGAGAGLSRVEIEETRMEFTRTATLVPGERRTDFAWMWTAGLAAPLGERTMLELAWRQTDFGTVETGRGRGRVVWLDGSRDPLELDLARTEADLSSRGFRVSLRYAF